MVQASARSSRVPTILVGLSGIAFVACLILSVTGARDDTQADLLNDLARLPAVALTAVLGLRMVTRDDVGQRERRSWIWLEVAFVLNVIAQITVLVSILRDSARSFPGITDYLFAACIPAMVAGVMLVPAARRTGSERLKLLVDSLWLSGNASRGAARLFTRIAEADTLHGLSVSNYETPGCWGRWAGSPPASTRP